MDIFASLGPCGSMASSSTPHSLHHLEAIGLRALEKSHSVINTYLPISNDARSLGTNFGVFLAPMMPRGTTIHQVPATSLGRMVASERNPMEISSSRGIQDSFYPMDRVLSTASKVFDDLPVTISKGVTFATVAGRSVPTSLIECRVL
ncbi:hypothetical protein COCNU_16G001670 [Cocos nucifera]|uniref:Uncharacterized protein n=1 Tax=Cocos nucifera TaxID=13894 RepID=A0A8K0NDJ0_COCNU|nr:hypothetical protein COCNU_16G001670 [Cocos nucifera]